MDTKKPETSTATPFALPNRKLRRWPLVAVLLVIGLLLAALSERLTIGPGWMVLTLIIVLIIPVIISARRGMPHHILHRLILGVIAVVTMAIVVSIVLLISTLPDKSLAPVSLLRDAALLWITNVLIFALWYWQIDAGGPVARHHDPDYRQHAHFLFPQLMPDCPGVRNPEHWRPEFIDYLFVAFNTSTAFSPTDTPVLHRFAKVLTMLQAIISLITLATLAARAINIL